ncbi:MAG: hypothetical protein ACKOJF_15135, partial [Planctomycetaceae bacterium]
GGRLDFFPRWRAGWTKRRNITSLLGARGGAMVGPGPLIAPRHQAPRPVSGTPHRRSPWP